MDTLDDQERHWLSQPPSEHRTKVLGLTAEARARHAVEKARTGLDRYDYGMGRDLPSGPPTDKPKE